MAEFVLDASVAFSWCFPGDPTEDTPYNRRIGPSDTPQGKKQKGAWTVRHQTLLHIKSLRKGQPIHLQDVYSYIYTRFRTECDDLGCRGKQRREPKWQNQVRQGFHLAEYRGLIKHVGRPKSGEWQRI